MIGNINVRRFFIYFLSFSLVNILLTYYLKKNITGTIKFIGNFWIGIILLMILLLTIISPKLTRPKLRGIISLLLVDIIFFIQLWYVGILEELLKHQNKVIYNFFSKVMRNKEMTEIVIMILIISFINSYNWSKRNDKMLKLIPEREDDLKRLKRGLDLDIRSFLIEKNWGEGKTFFINKFREKYKNDYDFIYIKANLLNDHFEFRKRLISELSKKLRKNGLLNIRLKDILKYVNVEFKGITLKELDEFYDVILNEINVASSKLPKKIVLIVDDLDRVNSKDKMNDIFNFIGEINYDLGDNLSLITLGLKSRIIDILKLENEMGETFLNKYLSKTFYLKEDKFENKLKFFVESEKLDESKKNYINKYIEIGLFKDQIIREEDGVKLTSDGHFSMRNTEKFVKELKEKTFTGVKEEIYFKAFFYLKYFSSFFPKYFEYLYNNRETLLSIAQERSSDINSSADNDYLFLKEILQKSTNFFISLLCDEFGITNGRILLIEELEKKILDINNKENLEFEVIIEIYNYFGTNYLVEEKEIILKKIIKNKKNTKFEKIYLIMLFNINIYICYNNFSDFKTEFENIKSKKQEIETDFINVRNIILKFIEITLIFSFIDEPKAHKGIEKITNENIEERLKEVSIAFFDGKFEDKTELVEIVNYLVKIAAPIKETVESKNTNQEKTRFERNIKKILNKQITRINNFQNFIYEIEICVENEISDRGRSEIIEKETKRKLLDEVKIIFENYSLKNEYYKKLYKHWLKYVGNQV